MSDHQKLIAELVKLGDDVAEFTKDVPAELRGAEAITALTEQLAAVQAVIAQIQEWRHAWFEPPMSAEHPQRERRSIQIFDTILSQSPTDALEAVKHAAWAEGYVYAYPVGFREAQGGEVEHTAPNPYRASGEVES